MTNIRIEAYHEILKNVLHYALALSKSKDPYLWELGHYMADNLLAKVCICIAIENYKENDIYKINKKTGKRISTLDTKGN